jgi:hypothetical protein
MDNATGLIVPCNKALVKTVYDVISYQINNDIVEIENGAFAHCRSLTSITVPNTLTKIGDGAFAYTSSLKNVNIPSGIIILPKELFYGSGIENIILPDSIEVIDNQCFYESSLKEIKFPENLTVINEEAFVNTKLVSINLLSNLERINKAAFQNCRELSYIEILSKKLNYIGWFVFNGCTKISNIKLLTVNAPTLDVKREYYTGSGHLENKDIYQFHPFGFYSGVIIGTSIPNGYKKIYVPYNDSGYDVEEWKTPLLRKENGYCGFDKEILSLEDNITVKGNILASYNKVYLKQESKTEIETISVSNSSFVLVTNNDVYDNETIIIYSDSACTNEIGRFVAHYKQTEYDLGSSQVLGSSNISLFNSNLFIDETETNKQNVEMANITKEEYEILQAKINQLMKLLNKK